MYLVNVYLIDPDPAKQMPTFTHDTLKEATDRATRYARLSYVASADVIAPGGRVIASYTTVLGKLVNSKEETKQ